MEWPTGEWCRASSGQRHCCRFPSAGVPPGQLHLADLDGLSCPFPCWLCSLKGKPSHHWCPHDDPETHKDQHKANGHQHSVCLVCDTTSVLPSPRLCASFMCFIDYDCLVAKVCLERRDLTPSDSKKQSSCDCFGKGGGTETSYHSCRWKLSRRVSAIRTDGLLWASPLLCPWCLAFFWNSFPQISWIFSRKKQLRSSVGYSRLSPSDWTCPFRWVSEIAH